MTNKETIKINGITIELKNIYPQTGLGRLIYIKRKKGKLYFKNLTMAPIDKDLIEEKLLTPKEKDYLFKYNLEVYNNISKFLNKKEKDWLLNSI